MKIMRDPPPSTLLIPPAWPLLPLRRPLSPQKNRWESVDGFAVDMSGFDTDDCNGGVHEDDDHSSSLSDPGGRPGPPLLVRDDLSVALGARRGTGGVKEEDGVRHRRAGSGSMSRPSLCRDQR